MEFHALAPRVLHYSASFTSLLLSCSPQDDDVAPTPLIAASVQNHFEVARFLVEHGASSDYQNKVFLTTLFVL